MRRLRPRSSAGHDCDVTRDGSSIDRQAVGQRIKSLRERAGVSGADVAKAAGVGPTQLWKYESGKNLPGAAELDAIARRLRTTSTYLLYGEAVSPLPADELYPALTEFLALPGVRESLDKAPWKLEQITRMVFPPGYQPDVQTYLLALAGLDSAEQADGGVTPTGDIKSS